MTIFMETTRIPALKTLGEIQAKLVAAGAEKIMIEYDNNKKPTALCFAIKHRDKWISFKIPSRFGKIYNHLHSKRKRYPENCVKEDKEQAEKVGWRQVYRWVEAQLAFIESGIVDPKEVFLPYMFDGKKTLYERAIERDFGLLIERKSTETD